MGVSPEASIYGMKVLDDNGEGDSSDVLGALDTIVDHAQKHRLPPSVVSMSLGGGCEGGDCQSDSVVTAVDKLTE